MSVKQHRISLRGLLQFALLVTLLPLAQGGSGSNKRDSEQGSEHHASHTTPKDVNSKPSHPKSKPLHVKPEASPAEDFRDNVPKVAIIGSGIGGAASAEFLRNILGENVDIDVFEREDHTCGRLGLKEIDGKVYNTGGCVIHPRNMYMVNLTKIAGLDHNDDDGAAQTYFYDQDKKYFALKQTGNDFVDTIWLLLKYGLSPIRLNWAVDAMLKDFDNIYALQAKGISFDTVEDMLHAMGGDEFVKMLQTSLRKYLESKSIGESLISELAGAAMAVNYGQNLRDMHAFVGMVSLAGVQPGLWSIKEGNGLICNRLFSQANVKVHTSTTITSIKRISPKRECEQVFIKYELSATDKSGHQIAPQQYDGVIIAAPFQLSHISLHGFPSMPIGAEGTYHQTIATFVNASKVKPDFFHDEFDPSNPPDVLATTPGKQFTSVGTENPTSPPEGFEVLGNSNVDTRVHKVFSQDPLKDETIKSLFGDDHGDVHPVNWKAYPSYSGFESRSMTPFNLDGAEGGAVAYTSPIEWAASAMEMSCIGANNAANIIAKAFKVRESAASKECRL